MRVEARVSGTGTGKRRIVALAAGAGLVILCGVPVLVFLLAAVRGFAAGDVTQVEGLMSWSVAGRSAGLAFAASLLAAAVGLPAGFAAGRLSAWRRAALVFVFIMPLTLPPAIHAYIWRNGALGAGLLGPLFVEGGSKAVNFCGAAWSLAAAYWPIPALAAFAVSAGAGRRYEAEARPFAGPGVVARKILLPMTMPAALAATGLVFVLCLGDYGAGALWRVRTFSEDILSKYSLYYDAERSAASALVPMGAVWLVAALVLFKARKSLRTLDVEHSLADASVLWRPGRGLLCYLCGVVAVFVGAPVLLCGYHAVASGADSAVMAPVLRDLAGTAGVSGLAAFIAAAAAGIAMAVCWVVWPRAVWLFAFVAVAAFLVPAVGLGVAALEISQWGFLPRAFGSTQAVLVYGLAGRYGALPAILAAVSLSGVDVRYRDLLRVSGTNAMKAALKVAMPIALPALVAAFAAAAVLGVGELSISSLLASPGNQPVSVHLFNLMHYAHQGEAFWTALAMMFGGAGFVVACLAFTRVLWKRYLPRT